MKYGEIIRRDRVDDSPVQADFEVIAKPRLIWVAPSR